MLSVASWRVTTGLFTLSTEALPRGAKNEQPALRKRKCRLRGVCQESGVTRRRHDLDHDAPGMGELLPEERHQLA